MTGYILTTPGFFSSPAGLPRTLVQRLAPLPGAKADWAADNLPDGRTQYWVDLLGGYTLESHASTASRRPTAEGGVLKFDGVDERADSVIAADRPVTFAIVARMPSVAGGHRLFTGEGGESFGLGTNSAGDRWAFYGSSTGFDSTLEPDTEWHVFVVVSDGANSVLSVDGMETAGNPGSTLGGAVRLGASNSGYFASEVKRFAVLPYAADLGQREWISAHLAGHYGI